MAFLHEKREVLTNMVFKSVIAFKLITIDVMDFDFIAKAALKR